MRLVGHEADCAGVEINPCGQLGYGLFVEEFSHIWLSAVMAGRLSTSHAWNVVEGVDARHKVGHDEWG